VEGLFNGESFFPNSAGARVPRSDVLMLSLGLLVAVCEIVEHDGPALLVKAVAVPTYVDGGGEVQQAVQDSAGHGCRRARAA
jgi:hypothetical protein